MCLKMLQRLLVRIMERIKIKNFRKIEGTWELDLAPITFFTGPNNSGKSSVLKAIMALDDFGDSDNHLELTFDGRNRRKHKIDSYTNAVNWFSQDKDNLDMEFEFDHAGYEVFVSFTPLVWENQKLLRGGVKHLFFQRQRDKAKLHLERKSPVEYQFYAEGDFFERRRKGEEYDDYNQHLQLRMRFQGEVNELLKKKEILKETDPDYIAINQDITQLTKKLNQINKQIKRNEEQKKNEDLIFSPSLLLEDFAGDKLSIDRMIRESFSRYFKNNEQELGLSNRQDYYRAMRLGESLQEALNFRVEHLSPQRNSQIRLYVNDETSTDIYGIINEHFNDPIPKKSKAGYFIKKWMERFDVGIDYNISPVQGVASIVQIKEGGKWINLVDKGFGAGQIFSIILRIAMTIHQNRKSTKRHFSRRNFTPIILIEEPETNLHPRLQSLLTDLFLEAFQEHGVRFIVETHSEYVLRRSQVLVKEGKDRYKTFSTSYLDSETNLSNSSFEVYYFDEEKGPYKMGYREDGVFVNEFGSGFFDVAARDALKLLKRKK